MSDRFVFTLSIDNRTSEHVKFVKADFVDGENTQDPVKDILPQRNVSNAFCAAGKSWSPFGTEGTVFFQIGSDETAAFSVYWFISSRPDKDCDVKLTQPPGGNIKVKLDDFKHGTSVDVVNCTIHLIES